MSNRDRLIDRAGRWFLHSGIQDANGGVARYYRSDLGENAKISTEITGYTVSALLYLNQRTGDSEYLESGLRAARFLARSAWDAKLGTFPFEYSTNGSRTSAFAYFFDCGIIVRALLTAWRVSNEAEFRDIAIAAGRSMAHDFCARGGIAPILALPDKRPTPYESRWSRAPGCYQLKSAMSWYELFETTGEMEFLRLYETAVEAALANEYGFLPGESSIEKTMDRLHAYLYFLEGLLPALDRFGCAQVFRAGIDRVSAYLREIAPVFARSDVYAQLLRVRLYGERLAGIPLDQPAAAHEAEQAAGFQLDSGDQRATGGFLFGRKDGEPLPFVNPVSTAFCVQALAQWDDRRKNLFEARRNALI